MEDKIEINFTSVHNAPVLEWLASHQEKYEINLYAKFDTKDSSSNASQTFHPPAVISNHFVKTITKKVSKSHKVDYECDEGSILPVMPNDICGKMIVKGQVKSMGQKVTGFIDSTQLLERNDYKSLWARYSKYGYLLFRNQLDVDSVLKVRGKTHDILDRFGCINESGEAISKGGWVVERYEGYVIAGYEKYAKSDNKSDKARSLEKEFRSLSRSSEVSAVVKNERIKAMLQVLSKSKSVGEDLDCGCDAYVYDPKYTFLRIKAPKECTPEHVDLGYFKTSSGMFHSPKPLGGSCYIDQNTEAFDCMYCRHPSKNKPLLRCDECFLCFHVHCLGVFKGEEDIPQEEWYCDSCRLRPNLGTCWIPLGDIDIEEGTLAILPGTTNLSNFDRFDGEKEIPSSYSSEGKGLTWHTGAFKAGDVVFFDSRVVHGSTTNYSKNFRMSIDFRWHLIPKRENAYHTVLGGFVKRNGIAAKDIVNYHDEFKEDLNDIGVEESLDERPEQLRTKKKHRTSSS